MRIVACLSGSNPMYETLANVLRYSITANDPTAVCDVHRTKQGEIDRYTGFVQKARDWHRVVRDASDGEYLVLLDIDMLVLDPLHGAFDHGADISVTERKSGRLNSGAIYVRVNEPVRRFFRQWWLLTKRMVYTAQPNGRQWSDQDALERLVNQSHEPVIVRLPCAVWNCEQTSWKAFGASTRVLHIKSDARAHLFEGAPLRTPGADRVCAVWREYKSLSEGIIIPCDD